MTVVDQDSASAGSATRGQLSNTGTGRQLLAGAENDLCLGETGEGCSPWLEGCKGDA